MSVDKTSADMEAAQKALVLKNHRDRFYEVAEYQNDILKYLKIVEVKTTFYKQYFQSFNRIFLFRIRKTFVLVLTT